MTDADLKELRKQCITSLYLCTDNVSKYLDSEKEAEYSKLNSYANDYCLLEAQQEVAIQALEKAEKETDLSNVDSLQDRYEKYLRSLAGKRLNVDKHPYVVEFKKHVEKGRLESRNNLDDSDFAITESQDQYLDPITKKPIVDPVKNMACGHVYEREAIMELIKRNRRTKCPVAGCGNRDPIEMDSLITDEELKFRMALTQHSTMIQDRSTIDLNCTT